MVLLSRAVPQGALERPERTLAGIAMVLAAMFVFSGMDGVSKILARDYHPVEISCLRFFFTTLVLAPFIWRSSSPVWRTNAPLLQIGRGLCLVGSSILFIFGLARLPIADATAIGFVAPLLVTALSIPLLGETVGLRRWTAVLVGFGGVLIVVRPGTGAFDPAAIYPLLSAGSWALGLILTRKMRNADPVLTTLLYSTLVGFVAGAVVLPFIWRQPTALDWALIAVLGVLNAIGQSLMVVALNRAAASLIAPFSYSQMLWSALIGYFVFATIPDATMWVGAAIIMASGLYTFHRERVVAQQRRRAAALPVR